MLYTKSNYLKLIIGPMFSSKSTHLLEEINRYKHITKNIICVNHKTDKNRYNESEDVIKTHNMETYKSFMCNNLFEFSEQKEYKQADIVIIDEAQFFPDLYIFIEEELKTENKKVFIVAGLSGDINLKPIGQILQLIPLANEIKQLSAFCLECNDGTLANFTRRKGNENDTILVGGTELYEPVCRYHYHHFKNISHKR
jgi:thymidine kinase